MDPDESIAESVSAADRVKQAKKNRQQQLKQWAEREKQFEKDKHKKSSSNKKIAKICFSPGETFLEAVVRNDIAEVRHLLDQNLNPDSAREDGLTALHQCCLDDLSDIMHLLVERGANVNVMDQERWTPLHAAAACGNVDTCSYLIHNGANLLAVNADGQLPYELCTNDATLDVLEAAMVVKGLTQDDVEEARYSPEREMFASLQDAIVHQHNLAFVGKHGESLLHIAAANGYTTVVQLLLDQKVSLSVIDDDGWQPLHSAAYWNEMAVLELLVYAGADLNARTFDGLTPYDLTNDTEVRERIKSLREEMWNKPQLRPQSSATRKARRSSSIRHTGSRDKSPLSQKDVRDEAEKLRSSFSFEEMEASDVSFDEEVGTRLVSISFQSLRADSSMSSNKADNNNHNASSNGGGGEQLHGDDTAQSAHNNNAQLQPHVEPAKSPVDSGQVFQLTSSKEDGAVRIFKSTEPEVVDEPKKKCCCIIL